jgi:hypothetical protein
VARVALEARRRLFRALEAAFPVAFRPWTAGMPGAAFLACGGERGGDAPADVVSLGHRPAIDRALHSVVFTDRPAGPPLVPAARGDEILALARDGGVWTQSRRALHRARSALPELGPNEVLYSLLSRLPIAAVALVDFLREACEDPAPRRPIGAALVFDDPNLRRRGYGFIDYRRLAAHADEHSYHAAWPTVRRAATEMRDRLVPARAAYALAAARRKPAGPARVDRAVQVSIPRGAG